MPTESKLRSIAKDAAHLASKTGEARALVILGCQRSGTNALTDCFEHDRHAKVYREHSSLNERTGTMSPRDSARYSLRLQPLDRVASRLARIRYPLAVLKPLVESQRAREMISALPRSRVVWLFRHFGDVAESNARTFGAGIHRINLAPIAAGDRADWRSEGASDEVRAFIGRHYKPDMDPVDGGALFWWARNRLLFDQGLQADPQVKPLAYERLIARPLETLRELYDYAGVPFPGPVVAQSISPKFKGRGSDHTIAPSIRESCEELLSELIAADSRATDGPRDVN